MPSNDFSKQFFSITSNGVMSSGNYLVQSGGGTQIPYPYGSQSTSSSINCDLFRV